MTNFPTSKDDGTSLPNPGGTDKQNSPDHSALHTTENAAIIAVETKLGTGSSVPASNTILIGTGAGTSAWTTMTSAQLAASISDETGTGSAVFGTTPTIITPKIDTINESTPSNGTTIGGVNIKSGALNTSNSVVTANITNSAVDYTKVATGFVVQIVNFETGTLATGTTLIPFDNTIPQNTEGDQYMTLAITPKSATDLLIIDVRMILFHSATSGNVAGALFQDSTASALATTHVTSAAGANAMGIILSFQHKMTAGTTSSTTFKVRGGGQVAGTSSFNGISGSAFFGGTAASSITITEYKA